VSGGKNFPAGKGNPPILILDEATSSVDNETEAAIQRSMKRIAKDRTTIVIAHRLSTIIDADQIYVLEHGKIAEQGTHPALMSNGGIYSYLWEVQTGTKAG
jgi:ATP-binding cassette subfamily B protein